ncbi:MAG: DUF2243 domain-containing protein [Candidatus Dormibacteria bacterium]
MQAAVRRDRDAVDQRRRLHVSGALTGVGIAAFVDETVFHQILHWHHFYDRSTQDVGLVSDGLFHAFGWFAVVAGLVLMADLVRRSALVAPRWWGAVLIGMGGFQLYDGLIQHKLLGLHQIRYGVDIVPYDALWFVIAVIAVAAGATLIRRSRHVSSRPA